MKKFVIFCLMIMIVGICGCQKKDQEEDKKYIQHWYQESDQEDSKEVTPTQTAAVTNSPEKKNDESTPTPKVEETEATETPYYRINNKNEVIEYYEANEDVTSTVIARTKAYIKLTHTLTSETNALQKTEKIASYWVDYGDNYDKTKEVVENCIEEKQTWAISKVEINDIIFKNDRSACIVHVTATYSVDEVVDSQQYIIAWVLDDDTWKISE